MFMCVCVCVFIILRLLLTQGYVCVCVVFFFLLSGGYENFHSQYPELCTEVKTIDQSGTETEKRVNSHSEKLSHHKPDYDQVWKHPLQYRTSHTSGHGFTATVFYFEPYKRKKKTQKKHKHPSPADIRKDF